LSAGVRRSRGCVTFFKSNAKALLTLRIKSALAPYGVEGALPRRLRTAPQYSSPFEKGGRTASLNFVTRRWAGEKAWPFLYRQMLSVAWRQGVRVVLPYGNLHPHVCPLDFAPAPRVGRDDSDGILDTATAPKNIDTTVTIVTLQKHPRSA